MTAEGKIVPLHQQYLPDEHCEDLEEIAESFAPSALRYCFRELIFKNQQPAAQYAAKNRFYVYKLCVQHGIHAMIQIVQS